MIQIWQVRSERGPSNLVVLVLFNDFSVIIVEGSLGWSTNIKTHQSQETHKSHDTH
jgi:hypothetical protein